MAWKWPLMGLLALLGLDAYIIISVTYTGSDCPELTVIFIGSMFMMIICIGWFFAALGHPKCKHARIRMGDRRIKGFNKTCIYHSEEGWRKCSIVDTDTASGDNSCVEESMIEDTSSGSTENSESVGHEDDPVIIEVEN